MFDLILIGVMFILGGIVLYRFNKSVTDDDKYDL